MKSITILVIQILLKKEIQEITVKMQHTFDKIEELTYIFGREYINEIRGE
jgi:hypothetical protein